MGRSLKLRVVAEGVENAARAGISPGSSMRRGAGLLFEPAGSCEQFAKLLKTGIPEASVVVHR
jgi:EAL domain-containing protein (putative c-di-GMP-specific phosphodiesterase class I)